MGCCLEKIGMNHANPLDEDTLSGRRDGEKLSVYVVAATRITWAGLYIGLFFLVHLYASGAWSTILTILLLVAIPVSVLCGLLLFFGAMNENVWALEVTIWLCLAMAAYNTVLGIMGLLYFVREGTKPIHFIVAVFFGLLAISIFVILQELATLDLMKQHSQLLTNLQQWYHVWAYWNNLKEQVVLRAYHGESRVYY